MGGGAARWLKVGAVVLAGGGAVYLWAINLAILRERDTDRIDELQLELMSTRDALRQAGGDAAFLNDALFVPMKANDRVAEARRSAGSVLLRGLSLYVAARRLPPAPKGKAYALWGFLGGKPAVHAGQYQCGSDGHLRGRFTFAKDPGPIDGFGLSLENAGASTPAAGPLFLLPH
jgi:hypothetical protein